MVAQNTVSRKDLTKTDRRVLDICEKTSKILEESISANKRDDFQKEYGRIHYSRDAGQGRAAGKLQRDALCTRGKQAKAPFSNRNLRWHPLVISNSCPPGFTEMDVSIDRSQKLLIFASRDDGKKYLPTEVYSLSKPYCVTKDVWIPYRDELRKWSTDDWIPNWCAIPVVEYSPWEFAAESYAILGIALAAGIFGADLSAVYENVKTALEKEFTLSKCYPSLTKEIVHCPLCNSNINGYPAGLIHRERPEMWKPEWEKVKRSEGEDESIQLTHVSPLVELEIRHNASNVRYGHRWCNVAMTDHSVPQTIEWMKEVVKKTHVNIAPVRCPLSNSRTY
jgi:hypothetical protein